MIHKDISKIILDHLIDKYRLFLVLGCLFIFASCTTSPPVDVDAADQEVPVTKQEDTKPDKKEKIVKVEPVRPKLPLTEDILYKILVAEFAGQRGLLDISVENYIELAKSTRDPKVVERATRIAVYARDNKAATEAAELWVELDPLNPDPHQVLAVMALRDGEMEAALEHLHSILNYTHGEFDQKLWLIANMLGREKDKEIVLNVMEQLVSNYEDNPDALYAFAHLSARLGDTQRAIKLLEMTLALRPDNDNAALSYISLLQRAGDVNQAIEWIEKTLAQRDSNDFNLRMAYARLLTDIKRFDDARRQFEILSIQAPNNVDVLYALGLLYLQSNRLEDSEKYFKRLVDKGARKDDANYYLGRISEERSQMDKAIIWYEGVHEGENYFDAQIRMSLIIAKQGNVEQAREHLKSIRTRSTREKFIAIQAEGELLIEENRLDEAMSVFDKALENSYDADLLYARAMLAEKMGNIELLEDDLKTILEKEPDHAQALNALGYTLADVTTRYEEAYEYIKRALELNPNDFYILDSMGWVLYRLGKLDEALEYLRRAMSLRPDPEIAAHLGEVLWVMGDKDAAIDVWDTALQQTPQDTYLLEVIKRFNP